MLQCDQNCLDCSLPKCILDIKDQHKYVRDNYERVRHAEYYKNHRSERIEKQKEFNKHYYTAEYRHEYYLKHKEEINKKNRERYANNREDRLAQAKAYYWEHKEEISMRRKLRRQGEKEE